MPKISTIPTLFDEVKKLDAAKLKQWHYLEPEQIKSGVIRWWRGGSEIGSISITADMTGEPQIRLSYNSMGEPVNYTVHLSSLPSNLGIGRIWLFICPVTGKRCRYLYAAGKYFLHREAHSGCLYESQTYSKQQRELNKTCRVYFGADKLYEELYSKYFKTHYAGKPTKRYNQIMRKIEQAELISLDTIEKMLIQA